MITVSVRIADGHDIRLDCQINRDANRKETPHVCFDMRRAAIIVT